MSADPTAVMTLDAVRAGFVGRPDFLGPIDLKVGGGDFWAIVGPNGAGKTTLLRVMAGILRHSAGSVSLGDRPLEHVPLRSRAQALAYLPQRNVEDVDLGAREIVQLGRYPYRSFGLFASAADRSIVQQALSQAGVAEFADRSMRTLSGGEAQRVHIAAALAQQPRLLLLDEPTASLDVRYQLSILGLLRTLASDAGMAVVVVLHDVNLALQFASHALLLDNGRAVASGCATEVLTISNLSNVYGVKMSATETLESPARTYLVASNEEPTACRR